MDAEGAVMDAGLETGAEEVLDGSQETIETEPAEIEGKIDGRVGSKAYRDALKAWESSNPEHKAFATQARAEHFKLSQIAEAVPGIWDEKRGTFNLDPIKSTFALIESVGGPEALTTMQERIAETDAVDELLAAGDPKALESLGPDFDAGLAKLAPSILDRIAKSDPAAYASAILPHLMGQLNNSPMVGELNKMVDLFSDPRFAALSDADKLKSIKGSLANIGRWYEAQEAKAGQIKDAPKGPNDELQQQRQSLDEERQTLHWDTRIKPDLVRVENEKFEQLLKPYAKRLNLLPAQKAAALSDFKARIKQTFKADDAYQRQMKVFRRERNPDPVKVQNYVKNALAAKAESIFNSVKDERWGNFLAGKKQTTTAAVGATTSNGASSTATQVSVKPDPNSVDWRRTSDADQWKGLYTLKNGKQVQWRKPN
jgi:hypothetical protein